MGLTPTKKLKYAKFVIENNPEHIPVIKRRLSLKQKPHGIESKYWKKALK